MEKNHFLKKDWIIMSLILFIAVVLRCYKINAPLSDAYSWRQADTASVARNFVKNGINLLQPRYDDLSSIQSGMENPEGLRYVEFPLYNATFALLYQIAPVIPVEIYGRIVSIFFSLITIAIVYYFLLKEDDRISAIAGTLVYSIFPAFVFFSRVVLPETTALGCMFLSIFFLYKGIQKKKIPFSLSIPSVIFFASSILIKPTTIFFGIVPFYLLVKKYEWDFIKKPFVYLYFFFAVIPFLLWRIYIMRFPAGIPASDWLITSVNTFQGQKEIFFKPAFFRWIFYERINLMICGGFLTSFLCIGILRKMKTQFLHSILLGGLLYLFVFQGGNVQHEYYQTLILAPIALFIGIGIGLVLKNTRDYLHPVITYPIIIFFCALSFFFSYYYKVKDFYTYPQDLNQMAKIINMFTKEDDKIITERMGDTTLLYLANRKGAPMLYKTLDQLKNDGYAYYITDQKDKVNEIKKNNTYAILFENDQFALIKL